MIRSRLSASIALALAMALGASTPGFAQQVAPPASAHDIAGTPPGTVMTKEYVETVGRFAYVWGWALVNNWNRALAVKDLPEPGRIAGIVPAAPANHISMLTDYIDAEEKFVTCPNQDTVYGAGFMWLDGTPVVIQVPDFGERFYTYQIVDARTESIASIGKQYHTKPGLYLLVGPHWQGKKPAGIVAVMRASTSLAVVLPRVFQDDTPEDKAAIQPLLRQIMVYPLSEYTGKMRTKEWKDTPSFPSPSPGGSGETKWVSPEKFFDELPEVLKKVPPLPGEEALYKTIQSVLDAAAQQPELKQALVEVAKRTEDEVISPLFAFSNNGRPVGNGWTSPPNGAHWGYDYLSRTATAKSNMYDNAPQETRYIYTDFDSDHARLDGANAYTVTFAKGAVPPVNGFWSLTLYNKEHLFEPNALHRYSIGTKNKSLRYNADGSLTLYVQNASPGADKETNWIPAPKDVFSLYIRAYWPKQAITDGSWVPPPIARSK